MAASPSKNKILPPHLSDSVTTITRTARTSVLATVRAIGNPFAASGTARKIVQMSRISSTVRAGSRNRSCHVWVKLRRLSTATECRLKSMHAEGPLQYPRSKHLGDKPEGVVGILVVAAMLSFRQLHLLARRLLVGDFAQDVSQDVEPRPPLVVGMNDVPRRP
jgi:hypothetical protein